MKYEWGGKPSRMKEKALQERKYHVKSPWGRKKIGPLRTERDSVVSIDDKRWTVQCEFAVSDQIMEVFDDTIKDSLQLYVKTYMDKEKGKVQFTF